MSAFHQLYENVEYEVALSWAIGMEGYLQNMEGIQENVKCGNISFATFGESGRAAARIKKQYHPATGAASVRNNVRFDKNMIISGPNAAGKTTIIKSTLLNIIFTQQCGAGFYKSCNFKPYTHLHSYLNIPDTSGRDSLFQAEARRCKEIIIAIDENGANARHFAIYDELFSGTNSHESVKTAQAFLKYMNRRPNIDFIMTTHFTEICANLKKTTKIKMMQMKTLKGTNGGLVYTYKLRPGVSDVMGAYVVLRDMSFPCEIMREL
jgi:DNA mismatch repair ATPase MutS